MDPTYPSARVPRRVLVTDPNAAFSIQPRQTEALAGTHGGAEHGDDEPKERPPAKFSRRVHITDPDAAFAELQTENDTLMEQIAGLSERLPTNAEMAYLRERKAADENAAWLWRTIKTHAPWVSVVASMIGTALWWLSAHVITIGSGGGK